MRLAGAFKDAVAHGRSSGNPGGAGIGRGVPVVARGVNFLSGTGGEVFLNGDGGTIKRSVARFHFDLPSLGGADGLGSRGLAFKQESGAIGHLCNGRVYAEVPNSCSD